MNFIIPTVGFNNGSVWREGWICVTSLHGRLSIVDLIGIIWKTLQVSHRASDGLIEHGLSSHKTLVWHVEVVRHGSVLIVLTGKYVVMITVWQR